MNFKKELGFINKSYSSDSKSDSNSDINTDMLTSINKTIVHNIEDMEELCEACIKSKYMKIIKLKKITLTMQNKKYTLTYVAHTNRLLFWVKTM